MYLNVNLTPPPSSGNEGSCTTPKTPEILNSLINLTSPPLPLSYSHYQCKMENGALQSPVSDLSSPGDDECAPSGNTNTTFITMRTSRRRRDDHNRHTTPLLLNPAAGGGGGGLIGGSPGTSGMGGPLTGSSPPSTPDLPSPVNTVEATKSALIKEGLKLQIRSKLQAAGVDTPESLLSETKIFKDLTEEDEERRRRRRERNKVAATKCRNKKKEKTHFLMTESENVEDVNLKLKTEIQRLTTEKIKLEKLLGDPNHRAHCRHTTQYHHTTAAATTTTTTTTNSTCSSSKSLRPPLLIITPAESSPSSSSSSSSSSASSTTSSSSLESPTSPPLSSYDPHITSPTHQSLLSMVTLPPLVPPTTTTTITSSDGVSCASLTPLSSSSSSLSSSSSSSSSSSQFLTPKYSPSHVVSQQRHHPYQFPAGRSHHHTSPAAGIGPDKQGYQTPGSPPPQPPPPCQTKPPPNYSNYQCLGVPQTHEFVLPPMPSPKSMYTAAPHKSRSGGSSGGGGGLVRYNPYSTRPPPVTSPLATHTHPHPVSVGCGGDSYLQPGNNSGCGREDHQVFVTDMHTNQFFPPCSYSNM